MKHLTPDAAVSKIKTTITLRSGRSFDYLNPAASDFTIKDIAHGLSNICRYNGHCREFYSVAQHSVLASRLAPAAQRLAALLHDGAEFTVFDCAKPLKNLLPDYRKIEERVEHAVLARFEISMPLDPIIKEIDTNLLVTEQRQLLKRRGGWGAPTKGKVLPIRIKPWSPKKAKRKFLERYYELVNERHFTRACASFSNEA